MKRVAALALAVLPLGAVGGCSTLAEVMALQNVDFRIASVSDLVLAGVNLDRVKNYDSMSITDAGRLAAAAISGNVPFKFNLVVEAANPADNSQARLVKMDWALFLSNKQTVSGLLDQEYVLEPGKPQRIPLTMSLDLADFFEGGVSDLAEVALSIVGGGAGPDKLRLVANPTIDTLLGPMQFPDPVTIYRR